MNRYFIVYKPYLVLSQFSKHAGKQTLSDYFKVPEDVYPVGRLDEDSEGLLILTNDKKLNHRLLNPAFAHEREYFVQVDGAITEEARIKMEHGVEINLDGRLYLTKPCSVSIFKEDPDVPPRIPPIRFRKNIPTTWIKIFLTEGKNRQVRKMTAKVGFATLRLLRYRIKNVELDNLKPGELIELSEQLIYKKLFDE